MFSTVIKDRHAFSYKTTIQVILIVLRDVMQCSNLCRCTLYFKGYQKNHFSYFKFEKMRRDIVENESHTVDASNLVDRTHY